MASYVVNWITESLCTCHAPMSYADLEDIKTQGINAIVNLCAEFSDLHDLEVSAGFEVYYLPIWDEDIPEMADMEKALAWLDEAIYLGKKVLVHCRHGIGRTGTFVTSYMIRKGFDLKAASKKLKTSNASPSNYGQWKLLKKYGKKSGVLKIREPSLELKNRVDLAFFFSDYESLIQRIDKEVELHPEENDIHCGKNKSTCCFEPFDLQLMEVVYLHSKMNRHFSSDQRNVLIKRAIAVSKKEKYVCPFNDGSGCEIYENRPARCRFYGLNKFSSDRHEIENMLFELSQTLFLSFSGKFIPDTDIPFSIADTISGKFVQKYFQLMAANESDKPYGP